MVKELKKILTCLFIVGCSVFGALWIILTGIVTSYTLVKLTPRLTFIYCLTIPLLAIAIYLIGIHFLDLVLKENK
jgi:hypothetical protein